MKVLKFGGTSVGTIDNMKAVASLVSDNEPKIVVLSAMSGTTDTLVSICNHLYNKKLNKANEVINTLKEKYKATISELYDIKDNKIKAWELVNNCFNTIESFTQKAFDTNAEKTIHAQGELMSTAMFDLLLKEQGQASQLLPALDFMRTDEIKEPDYDYIKHNIKKVLDNYKNKDIYITQGYICLNSEGNTDNLQRGGSDYTATIIGAAVEAEEIQIWTDIDGIHNNDPRIIDNTYPIDRISFDEAAELAYFGAKVLHPTSMLPAKLADIPVRLKNTMNPSAPGTLICKTSPKDAIKAIAAKDGITKIKIKSGRMLMAFGFLRKVFEIFEKYETPIDMITTSEVGVSLTIDNHLHLENILKELNQYGTVTVDDEQAIICIVGHLIGERNILTPKIFEALKNIPLQMISYGGSINNISLLVQKDHKKEALEALNNYLF